MRSLASLYLRSLRRSSMILLTSLRLFLPLSLLLFVFHLQLLLPPPLLLSSLPPLSIVLPCLETHRLSLASFMAPIQSYHV